MLTMRFECPNCETETDLNYEELSVYGKCQNCGAELYASLDDIGTPGTYSWKVYELPHPHPPLA